MTNGRRSIRLHTMTIACRSIRLKTPVVVAGNTWSASALALASTSPKSSVCSLARWMFPLIQRVGIFVHVSDYNVQVEYFRFLDLFAADRE